MAGEKYLNPILNTVNLLGGFAWNYYFKITSITDPNNANNNLAVVKDSQGKTIPGGALTLAAAKLPATKLNSTKVPFGAFECNVPMNVTFPDNLQWVVSLYADEQGQLRRIFETWQTDLYNYNTQSGKTNFKYDITLKLGNKKQNSPSEVTAKKAVIQLFGQVRDAANDPIKEAINNILAPRMVDKGKGEFEVQNLDSIKTNLDRLPNKGTFDSLINTIIGPKGEQAAGLDWDTSQEYTLYGCYPLMLDGIQFTAENPDVIKFTSTLAYQYFVRK